MLKQRPVDYVLVIVSLVGYYFLGYEILRFETLPLFTAFSVLFLTYLWIVKSSSDQSVSFWIAISLIFRASLIFSLPQLSDDLYRFIWDGRLWAAGHHPFAALPSEYLALNIPGIDQDLYDHLNSKPYFTVYPPVAQYIFWLSVKVSPDSVFGSVIVMRIFIFLAEVGSILLMKSLLEKFKLPVKNVLFYALNPLIILELTGNLHFEGVMIFFLMLSIFLLTHYKIGGSAIAISVAVCTKLLPLMFLPSVIGRLTWKKLFFFFVTVAIACFCLFLPFLDWEVINSIKSMSLYFNKFEFNASLYYLVREFGYTMYGYNIIQTVGWKLAATTFILIMSFVWIRSRQSQSNPGDKSHQFLFQDWMWILFIYFLFTTTLHPWYICTLLALSIFTSYRFVVVWTGLIFLTYAGYSKDSFHEILWLTAIEYIIVIVYLGTELWTRRSSLYIPWKNRNLFT